MTARESAAAVPAPRRPRRRRTTTDSFFPRFLLLVALLWAAPATAASPPEDLRVHLQLAGGKEIRKERSPVAAILTDNFLCSGILVGFQEVLTAAHCLDPQLDVSDYIVEVGGEFFSVAEAFFDPNFDHLGAADDKANSSHDIGILVLDNPVSNVLPRPIWIDKPLGKGDKLSVSGFGLNEFPFKEDFKARRGNILVEEVDQGIFSSTHIQSGVSSCAGDSGGPAASSIGPFTGVSGIIIAGTNGIFFDECEIEAGGLSLFLDLQSPSAREFLSNFPELFTLSAASVRAHIAAQRLRAGISQALRTRSRKSLRKELSRLERRLVELRKEIGGERKQLLAKALKQLRRAIREDSSETARRLAKDARRALGDLVALGVE